MSHAETWIKLRTDPRCVIPTFTRDEWRQWREQCALAAPPKDQWDPMIHVRRDRRVRVTRFDFPDASSAVAIETWHVQHEAGSEFDYEVIWRSVPGSDR